MAAFARALEDLEDALGEGDGNAAGRAFEAVKERRPADIRAQDLRRMFRLCYRVLGLDGAAPPDLGSGGWQADRVGRQASGLIEDTFVDEGGRHREFVARRLRRSRAMGVPAPEGAGGEPVPTPHVPLHRDEARELAGPWLDHLRARATGDTCAHLRFAWNATELPVPPFDRVIDDWLADLDRDGIAGGANRDSLDRARALVALADERQQRLTWQDCERHVLPQLSDQSAMVAGAAGRFLGRLLSDPAQFFVRSTPPPLSDSLDRLALLESNRRIAAGGFLQGLDPDMRGPFSELAQRLEGTGYDIDGWVMRIFDAREPEPALPSAQSFWFHVHEAFFHDVAFIGRLIDAGHAWEALMCATESHEPVEGMEGPLRRLAASSDAEIAEDARDCLVRVYGAA